MRILQINVTANSGSTGRIAEGIGQTAQEKGFESWIAYGRYANKSTSHLIRIGSKISQYEHVVETRLFDNHGLASRLATNEFIKEIEKKQPDIIHLHNIHGYYINYKILFDYLAKKSMPVVWTLHDCWPFTGHCSYFSITKCEQWKTKCSYCMGKKLYPKCIGISNASRNFDKKKNAFTSIKNMTIVSVSKWLDSLVGQSILNDCSHYVIYNGIDIDVFAPVLSSNTYALRRELNIDNHETMLLGVANVWNERKGLDDFIELSKHLAPSYRIVLIGLNHNQLKNIPKNIIGIERTESTKKLATFYSAADLFLNLTYEDNYPTTNLESISCGTRCLTYQTGGSPESITQDTGIIVEQGNLRKVLQEVYKQKKDNESITRCREHAIAFFDQKQRFQDYITLYQELLLQ